ncbi:hypothetical protein PVAP13_7NG035617 [Panicum virgatum]|uniref:Uncharacterized protein n=1 Tax=Panicum virgatum TaxID=38727 RepID=A0A8T0Q3A0_PANVG|nr:hypothetical protein PVAP13_7NG035617 [Panicum virgatum]
MTILWTCELLVCWNGIIRMIILTTCSSAAALLKSLAKRCSKSAPTYSAHMAKRDNLQGWRSRTCKELEAKKGSSNKEVLNEREQ